MNRTAFAALVTALALSACGEEPFTPQPDAGVEVDAGADAGADAGTDAGSDAGSDAGEEPEPTTNGPYTLVIENESEETIAIGYVVVRDRESEAGWIALAQDIAIEPGAGLTLPSAIPPGACQSSSGTRMWLKLSPVHYSGDQWATVPPLAYIGSSWQSAPTYAYDIPCAVTTLRATLARNGAGEPSVHFEPF